jgi:hypothetical protein
MAKRKTRSLAHEEDLEALVAVGHQLDKRDLKAPTEPRC